MRHDHYLCYVHINVHWIENKVMLRPPTLVLVGGHPARLISINQYSHERVHLVVEFTWFSHGWRRECDGDAGSGLRGGADADGRFRRHHLHFVGLSLAGDICQSRRQLLCHPG
jgi:hypothetical protein